MIKNRDHKDKVHVIKWAENRVELWSSKEEKMSTIMLSFVCDVCVSSKSFANRVYIVGVSSYNRCVNKYDWSEYNK